MMFMLETRNEKFTTLLSEMSTMSSLFSVDSSKDFTHNRILTYKEILTIILGMAGGSLNRELYDHFKTKLQRSTGEAG